MAEMPDGNTAALDTWEREELFRDLTYERRSAAAASIYKGMLRMVDSSVLRGSLDEMSGAEWTELCDMVSDTPAADPTAAGWLIRRTLERYLFDQALAETE